MNRKQLRDSIEQELHGNLLPFWRERSLDTIHGGFVAEMSDDGTLNDTAPKGLILNARLLWTFSALYRELADKRDLALAQRAYDYLAKYFYDREYGGYVWRVDPGGGVLDSSKKIYGQAFSSTL
jgi:mannobiose 2-epimerase